MASSRSAGSKEALLGLVWEVAVGIGAGGGGGCDMARSPSARIKASMSKSSSGEMCSEAEEGGREGEVVGDGTREDGKECEGV